MILSFPRKSESHHIFEDYFFCMNNTDLYFNLLNKFTPFFIDFQISIGIIPRYLLGKLTPKMV